MPSLLAAARAAGDDADALYDAFLGWSLEREIELYPAQDEAVMELVQGNNVILATPTGTGKSLVAIAAHAIALGRGQRTYYTAPIKALVSEKFFALVETRRSTPTLPSCAARPRSSRTSRSAKARTPTSTRS